MDHEEFWLFGLSAVAGPPEAAAASVADEALVRGRIELGTAMSLAHTKGAGE